jgi:hypothetical protein
MQVAMDDLELSRLLVIYPGIHPYRLADNIQAVPLAALAEEPSRLLE